LTRILARSKTHFEVDAVRVIGDWAVEDGFATLTNIPRDQQGIGQTIYLVHKVNGTWKKLEEGVGSMHRVEGAFADLKAKYPDAPSALFAEPFGDGDETPEAPGTTFEQRRRAESL